MRSYERLLPLVPQAAPLDSLKRIRRGDCVVAFSRRDVHAIKRAIDSHGALKCCMVYGALPAEVRVRFLLWLLLTPSCTYASCSLAPAAEHHHANHMRSHVGNNLLCRTFLRASGVTCSHAMRRFLSLMLCCVCRE